jgi:hypothetical protein
MRPIRFAVPLALIALQAAAPAAAHEGDPRYRSRVTGVSAPGVSVEVLNFDDSLELRNDGARTVTVVGYRGEPYARVRPDGTVELNRRSPATYLNDDRFAEVEVPRSADPAAPPRWREVDRSGRLRWHDHRMHWMGKALPPQVKDEGRRAKVFDWKVPLRIGGRPETVTGTLVWVGRPGGGFPLGAGLSFAAAVLIGAGLVLVVRRRRKREAGRPQAEAW